eukprot:gnl/Dysnectes_brevis/4897_a6801_596.p1 GENE.gnl/Dysnectes_brevis/4897_a6801_596~~gnl/Dysnectes_brevis/4897_a6801_596.p1  ORF type:complete len:499 (-),score=141.02 gnl/Dysnectes_brevis/4897_a6801_596:80-1576(-)
MTGVCILILQLIVLVFSLPFELPPMSPHPLSCGANCFLQYRTSLSGERLSELPHFTISKSHQIDTSLQKVSIVRNATYQPIAGFGGAITDASSDTWAQLPESVQDEVIDAYFGPSGIGMSFIRTHINSCDYSPYSYAYDEVEDDFELVHFSVDHDTATRIPMLLRAVDTSESRHQDGYIGVKLLASPWSPPAWMKTNGMMCTSLDPGLKQDARHQAAWSLYFLRFLREYREWGLEFWGITIENEPVGSHDWECCSYTGEEEGRFLVDHLGPALQGSEFAGIEILAFDHDRCYLQEWLYSFYTVPGVEDYVTGLAFHWYRNTGPEDFGYLRQAVEDYEPPFYGTEACNCPFTSDVGEQWGVGEDYSADILHDLRAGASSWICWNLLLDSTGGPNHLGNVCNSPMTATAEYDGVDYEPSFYSLAHFARFVPEGSVRVDSGECDVSPDNVEHVAFLVGGDIVLVLLNRGGVDRAIEVEVVGRGAGRLTVPAHSIISLSQHV